LLCTFDYLIYPKTTPIPENGFMVGVYSPKNRIVDMDGNEQRRVTVVGHALPIVKNVTFELAGNWEKNKRGKTQFHLQRYKEHVESTKESILSYLSSGILKGIGPGMAQKIYTAFGNDTIQVLTEEPERLLEVHGISEGKLRKIKDSIVVAHGVQELLDLLHPHISVSTAVKILNQFKSEAIEIAKTNPYAFVESGFLRFSEADEIALSNGILKDADVRIDSGLCFCIKQEEQYGHLCIQKNQLAKNCMRILKLQKDDFSAIRNGANRLYKQGKICVYGDLVYLDTADSAEQSVASMVKNLLSFGYSKYSSDLSTQIFHLEEQLGLTLSPRQKEAVLASLTHNLSVITGGPGTGKTQVLQFILQIFQSEFPKQEIICCAPTGRAARRMEEATGILSSTIHSKLSITTLENGELTDVSKLNAGLVVIDEVSMLDMYLAQRLFQAIPYDCKVILVGDSDQLPSVGPGAVLSELLASENVPFTKLDKVFRQCAGSRIAINAALIRHDNYGLEYGTDFVLEESADPERSAALLIEAYQKEVEEYGMDSVTILSPFRSKLATGVEPLNLRIRDLVNPSAPEKSEIQVRKKVFREGDKIIQTKNIGEINNGDLGYIRKIISEGNKKKALLEFEGSRMKSYSIEELVFVELGYATTIHKSQGAEYRSVLLNIQNAHSIMLKRPLLYTAITRAKEHLKIVGERSAVIKAIQTVETEKRLTLLSKRIREGANL
jgi:helicase, putative, RecD/TraA family